MNVSVFLTTWKFKHNASYFQTTWQYIALSFRGLWENFWMLQIYHSSWSDTHLSDVDDIFSCSCDFIRKANGILVEFGSCDPLFLTKLLTCFRMSLYGCALWSHDSCAVKHLDICMSNCLRHICPRNGPTSILHSVSGCSSVLNTCSRTVPGIYGSKQIWVWGCSLRTRFVYYSHKSLATWYLCYNCYTSHLIGPLLLLL